ncbi:MAG: C4-dicarboxylic acid transporter DauA [Planctomycetes bacterium]|nr:C4-dicarboxylic acid transporter DauA [Planctomycetota bacterium]
MFGLPGRALRASLATGYSAARLRADVVAGLIVGLVALPLSMALAIATGVPPQNGLYTAIVAGAAAALLGGSRVQVTGPTAAFVVVLAPIVAEHGLAGLCLATAMAGAILVAMGALRMGRIVNLVPFPVTTGFTLGIGFVIAVGQLPDFLGVTSAGLDPHPFPRLAGLTDRLTELRSADLGLGTVTLAVLLLLPRLTRRVPAPLVALTVAALLGELLRSVAPNLEFATLGSRFDYVDEHGATVPGIPPWPPQPLWPWQLAGGEGSPWPSLALLRTLLPSALAIAMLGAIESLLSATVADGMTRTRHDPDAELIGQGTANLIAPFFGGFAATGAIARTATNVRSGATSPIASVVHAGFVLVAMLGIAPLLGLLPMAALAALLILVAWNMAEVRHVLNVVRTAPGDDVGVLAACFLLTAVFDMVVAVGAGIVLASLLFMRRMAELSRVQVLPGGTADVANEVPARVLVYEVAGPLFFGAAEKAMGTVGVTGTTTRVVVLSLAAVPVVDATGLVNLRSALARLHAVGTAVVLAGLQDQPSRALNRAGIVAEPGRTEFAPTLAQGIARARELVVTPAP